MKRFQSIVLAAFTLFVLSAVGIYAQDTNLPFGLYLPIAAGNGQANRPTPVPTNTPVNELAMRREVIRLVNEYRVANGCPAATEHTALMNGAQAWSDYMRANQYFDHSSAVDSQWYIHHGYVNLSIGVAENLGSGYENAEEVIQGWKISPNHNRTLLSCHFVDDGATYEVGVGLNGRLWTLALGERLP